MRELQITKKKTFPEGIENEFSRNLRVYVCAKQNETFSYTGFRQLLHVRYFFAAFSWPKQSNLNELNYGTVRTTTMLKRKKGKKRIFE